MDHARLEPALEDRVGLRLALAQPGRGQIARARLLRENPPEQAAALEFADRLRTEKFGPETSRRLGPVPATATYGPTRPAREKPMTGSPMNAAISRPRDSNSAPSDSVSDQPTVTTSSMMSPP